MSRSVEVHTLRYGDRWWVRECGDSLDRWAERHGYAVRSWGQDAIPSGLPHPKFVVVDMLRAFLSGSADLMLYIDADVLVDPDAPDLPDAGPDPFITIRAHKPDSLASRKYHRWISKHYPNSRRTLRSWRYRNAGVWICNRAAAEIIVAAAVPPFIPGVMEQHQWNQWLSVAEARGVAVVDLPRDWNMLPGEDAPAFFFHLCGRHKIHHYDHWKNAGLLKKFHKMKQSFDFEKYRFAHCGTNMPMDEMHIQMLHASVRMMQRSGIVAVEIGSFRGASTSALVEAVNEGLIDHLHVIEIKPTPTLMQVLGLCKFQDKITVHTVPSWQVGIEKADLVFIDGNHGWPALADVLTALRWGASVIGMHDTNAVNCGHRGCFGSGVGSGILSKMPGRQWFEDKALRPGMRTQRGFGVSAATGIDMSPLHDLV